MTTHRFDPDTDRCTCGGQWVYHEDDVRRRYGYGCEVYGKPLHACCEGRGSGNGHATYCDNCVAPAARRGGRRA